MKKFESGITLIKGSTLSLVIVILLGMILPASAVPVPPNLFYGSVTLNGEPAPSGTNISAYIDGVCKGSIELETAGTIDSESYLVVKGENNKTITFTINGVKADETSIWLDSTGPRQMDLTAAGTSTGDSTPPDITITSPLSNDTVSTADVTVSGTASDNVGITSVETKLGSGDWEQASGADPWSASITLYLGSNTIYARATDTTGLVTETSVIVNYAISTGDVSPPEISIVSPSNDAAFSTADVTISGTASDNNGIDNVKVKVGSGDWEQASGTDSWSKTITLIPGPNTIYAIAADRSGLTTDTFITLVYNKPSKDSGSGSIGSSTPVEKDEAEVNPVGTGSAPTEKPDAEIPEEEENRTDDNNETPGFSIIYAIAGLLIIGYLVKK